MQLTSLESLEAEGYEVFRSAQDRTRNPWRTIDSRDGFLDEVRWFVERSSALLLAGLVDRRMGGWMAGFAAVGTAYIEIVALATDALATQISIGLHFEFIEACHRSGLILEISRSPPIPEGRASGRLQGSHRVSSMSPAGSLWRPARRRSSAGTSPSCSIA